MLEIFRIGRIGDVDDRGSVELRCTRQRIDRLRMVGAATVVAHIGDVAIALLMDGRLVGAARLQIAVADKAHVGDFGRIADLGRVWRLLQLLRQCQSGDASKRKYSRKHTRKYTRK